ncbi:MAG: Fic family protein [Fusobacteriaceae bacterium]|nr:Fic family protein [Fusobacteriaceae bacterium]MBU9918970.1 Fic family protein [Fusobacteriaceae bacterium]
MKLLEEFISGTYTEEYQYKAFLPNPINEKWFWQDSEINMLLEEANRTLGEINAFSILIPNIDLFIKMHITKEANTSSKIEGTKTEMDEAIMKEEEITPERRDDWKEVHQYIEAMNGSIKLLNELPLSNRLIRETHKILLQTVRGENKMPGDFRISQNWIGGSSLASAKFIPPNYRYIDELMGDVERFIHNESNNVPHLIKIAILHYQFETIHPFLDGNGRVGRLLITLYLVGQGILNKPALYLSDYLERNRDEYYSHLTAIREKNQIIPWIKFFLKGIISTATNAKETFIKIIQLQKDMEVKLHSFGTKSEKINTILNSFYDTPILSVKDIVTRTGIADKTTRNMIELMLEEGLIKEMTGYGRNKLFIFEKYFNLFK